ncbi:hypothetical protein [Sphingorhabdus lutea]|nr:hypothetical protein [Sphingorhabdus lutea]
MNHMPYIIAAFAVTFAGIFLLSWDSYVKMKRAEKSSDDLRKDS